MSSAIDYDSRKYPCCAPWDGMQGPEFTRRFAPEFKNALHMHQDGYNSLHDHLLGIDVGGPNGPAHPGGGAAPPSIRAFDLRSKKLYGLIVQHVIDIDIKTRL